jgi:hypothetical protein
MHEWFGHLNKSHSACATLPFLVELIWGETDTIVPLS